ncbi:hypothetical protein SLA2020_430750 [Shorea laevis]
MLFNDSEEPDLELEEEAEALSYCDPAPTCSQGHRSTLILHTQQGGSICLLCFSNLVADPLSPTLHVSYALSQLSLAVSQPQFLHSLRSLHSHLLVSPLVKALSSFDDEPIARQLIDLILNLCGSGDGSLCAQFVAMLSDRLASGALGWSRRQVFTLHCLGVLLNCQTYNLYAHIKDKYGLVSNLVAGLQLPSEEIRGEILFVLYKVSVLQYASEDGDGTDVLLALRPKILHLVMDALMKTQIDDVRLNCLALLTVLSQRGFFANVDANDTSSMNSYEADNFIAAEDGKDGPPLHTIFAEAIKGPLLSSDSQVQLSTLDLLFHYLSCEGAPRKHIQVLVEENIADYVFEILRLSECRDAVVNSCIQILDLLSMAEQAFKQRLFIGFATLIPVVSYVAEVPFHPVQSQTLKLIWNCVSDCPGMLSNSQIEELAFVFTRMLKRHNEGEMGMLPQTLIMVCLVFVALMKLSSSHGTLNLARLVQEASKHAILGCLDISEKHPIQLLHSLYLLKEAYLYGQEENFSESSNMELRKCVVAICTKHLLPWVVTAVNEIEENIILGVLETFHSILLQDSDIQAMELAKTLVSSSWFSFSFGCLGLYPTEKMKCRVYLMLSSLVDALLGNDSGQPIKDAALYLPSDPVDLLFLLGQKSSHNLELSSCQSAILLILYTSSLYDERLADEKLVLASLEDYLLVNCSDLQSGAADSLAVMRLVNLYGLFRGLAEMGYRIPYSLKAEGILFQLMTENEWDLPSAGIHSLSLKCSNGTDIIVHGRNDQVPYAQAIAELVAAGDNYGATIFLVRPEILIDDENWLAVIMKLMKYFNPSEAADRWNPETLVVIGILSLYNPCCHLKGACLVDHDEGTSIGESLIFALLLNYFSLRSLPAVLPGFVDWQNFFDPQNRTQPLSFIGIHCHDLCRLLHFGSSLVKLVASYSLLELLTRLSDQLYEKHLELKCTMGYLLSVIAVLEGLVFYSDPRVAMNSGICLSIILGWKKLDMHETTMVEKSSWCRLIVEELAMSLAAPCLASKSFINHHKPAIHVAVAMLKLQKVPGWMRSVFDGTCISCIIENLAISNMSTEMVMLIQELLDSKFLKTEQIANLNRVLQAHRKHLNADNAPDDRADEHVKKIITTPDDMGEVREYLVYLMSSKSSLDMDSRGLDFGKKRLLEEIELFFRTITVEDDG